MEVVGPDEEDLLLELLNTAPVIDGRPVDELEDRRSAQAWAVAHGGVGTFAEIEALCTVRDALAPVVRGGADPRELAEHLQGISLRPTLHEGTLAWKLQAPEGEEIAARALLAWTAMDERMRGRLRPCSNPDCRRFLLDRSNGNTARWCSMATCGNRAKARRHYQRQRADR